MKTTSNSSSPECSTSHLNSRHILIAASVLIAVGYLLMSGSGSTEQSFNPDIFSSRRIVVAPMLCLVGYLLIAVGIQRKK